MAAEVMSHINGKASWKLRRPYLVGALAHLRALAESGNSHHANHNDLFSLTDAFLCIDDAFRAAVTGAQESWSDADIERLPQLSSLPNPSVQDVVGSCSSGSPNLLTSEMNRQWFSMVFTLRRVATEVSSKLAPLVSGARGNRTRTVDLLDLSNALDIIEQTMTRVVSVRDRLRQVQPDILGSQWWKGTYGTQPDTHLDILLLCLTMAVFVIAHIFSRWKILEKECARFTQIAGSTSAISIITRHVEQASAIEATLDRLLVASVCLIGGLLMDRKDVAGFELICHLSPLQPIQHKLSDWAKIAMKLPHAEQGGPLHYPLSLKVQITNNLIAGLRAQSFSWAHRACEADECQAALQSLLRVSALSSPAGSVPRPGTISSSAVWASGSSPASTVQLRAGSSASLPLRSMVSQTQSTITPIAPPVSAVANLDSPLRQLGLRLHSVSAFESLALDRLPGMSCSAFAAESPLVYAGNPPDFASPKSPRAITQGPGEDAEPHSRPGEGSPQIHGSHISEMLPISAKGAGSLGRNSGLSHRPKTTWIYDYCHRSNQPSSPRRHPMQNLQGTQPLTRTGSNAETRPQTTTRELAPWDFYGYFTDFDKLKAALSPHMDSLAMDRHIRSHLSWHDRGLYLDSKNPERASIFLKNLDLYGSRDLLEAFVNFLRRQQLGHFIVEPVRAFDSHLRED